MEVIKGGWLREGKFPSQGSLPSGEHFSCKGWHKKKQRNTGENKQSWQSRSAVLPKQRGSGWLHQVAQRAAGCGSSLMVLTAKAFPEPTPARVLSVRFFFPILSVSCFTPHPPILVWLSYCLVSLILDCKHSGAGNTSFYSQEAVLLWHYMHN